jgi:hypothetical protein
MRDTLAVRPLPLMENLMLASFLGSPIIGLPNKTADSLEIKKERQCVPLSELSFSATALTIKKAAW